jgi:hypothetical protein
MTHRTIHIRGWRVDVFIDGREGGNGLDDMLDTLEAMGAPFNILARCDEMVVGGVPNQAFTYSNGRRTCIYIGWTTSGEEFLNSMIHEIRHLVDHIAAFYGLDNNEAVGYLSGDAALLLAEDICEHGCPHCRQEEI